MEVKTNLLIGKRGLIMGVAYNRSIAWGLANACWKIIERDSVGDSLPKILHWSDAGISSWYDFAVAIGELGRASGLLTESAFVKPITIPSIIP